VRSFEELVSEADSADVTGWKFEWLQGRATEERPPWGYATLLAAQLSVADSALDIDTGGGEVVNMAEELPPRMAVTEAWPPNLALARARLEPRGVQVVHVREGAPLPFDDHSFELVTARHPVRPDWPEIHRVLAPGGRYFAQHVGPASARELIEAFIGPLDHHQDAREPATEVANAEAAGFMIEDLRSARCRMEFYDIGAIVWILRRCVWWVPDFAVARYRTELLRLDAQMREEGPFVAHSTRHLITARR
jgi:SAM-dependent methyltransferase